MEELARRFAAQVSDQLPAVLQQLLQANFDQPLQLECRLTAGGGSTATPTPENSFKITAVDIGRDLTPFSPPATGAPSHNPSPSCGTGSSRRPRTSQPLKFGHTSTPASATCEASPSGCDDRPSKRQKVGDVTLNGPHRGSFGSDACSDVVVHSVGEEGGVVERRKKRTSDNPALQPSTLDKFINGVWENVFSGLKMDPTEVIEQWQAIEASGQPKLLRDTDHESAISSDSSVFARMNVLTRKISQTSKTCRSLEVIVQAHWVRCFDERVAELTANSPRDKAKKTAMAQACVDFSWTEKELRNKMAIWRGYHDIQMAGGWAALVFAGMGLYRFCKYRISFTEETFCTLKNLRHRFEVAADTLHPRWRALLAIVGEPMQRKYTGHPHDWVVNGPGSEAMPLAETYHKWDPNFTYTHLAESAIDEEAWGHFDPRTYTSDTDPAAYKCQLCDERQSDDPIQNHCRCFPNLYGSPKAGMVPLQVFRTPNGKNNGLITCCAFEKGMAVGEFVGMITQGVEGKDVMFGQTHRATYQIWQGKQGNYTRFVNHSCEPNSQFEQFVWLGKQRTVLVSKGIETGQEVTVDYSDTYWRNLSKACLCGAEKCRYRNRTRSVTGPSASEAQA